MKVHINVQLCKGCEFCVRYCPKQILEMGKGRNAMGDHTPGIYQDSACTACAICARMCPEGAVELREEEVAV